VEKNLANSGLWFHKYYLMLLLAEIKKSLAEIKPFPNHDKDKCLTRRAVHVEMNASHMVLGLQQVVQDLLKHCNSS
jgi:hypothetical protein